MATPGIATAGKLRRERGKASDNADTYAEHVSFSAVVQLVSRMLGQQEL